MESIENYKKRFFNLMESTMGDVRPLITEQLEQLSPDKIREYKAKWSVSNVLKNENSKEMYQTAIVNGNLIPKEITEDSQVLAIYQNTLNDGSVVKMVSMYDMYHNTKSSELGKSPITNPQELTGDELTKFYNVMIATYMNQRDDFKDRVIRNYDLIDIYNKITDKEKLAAIGQKQISK